MASRITRHLRNVNLNDFNDLITAGSDYVYAGISKTDAWSNEAAPDTPTESVEELNQYYIDAAAYKKLTATDFRKVVRRIDWTSGTVYTQYASNDSALWDKDFYVLTTDYNVYKCLYNAGGIASTVKPTGTGTTNITTGDGYIWKYLYTVDSGDIEDFLTTRWMPIDSNSTVVSAAVDGKLERISVTSGGSGYTSATVSITSNTGSSATATATVSTGAVNSITLTAAGTKYRDATISISGDGTGATGRTEIGPYGGHGANPEVELGCRNMLCLADFNGDEGGDFPTDISYRRIFFIINPKESDGTTAATDDTYADDGLEVGSGRVLMVENRQAIARGVDEEEKIRFILYF